MIKIASELADGFKARRPVVALESTLICHGIPRPDNGDLAIEMERRVRDEGALPATMAIVDGDVRIGLTQDELLALATADGVLKCSTRDLPMVTTNGGNGATTVASTIFLAAKHGIEVMATGGLGGVHQGGEVTLDISADLYELQRSRVAVICCGVKSILDQRRTVEQLETLGVPLIGFRCRELPAFYTADSDIEIPSVDHLDELVNVIRHHLELGLPGGLVIAVPPPAEYAMTRGEVDQLVDEAQGAAGRQGMIGPAQTPFMLRHMAEASGGRTVILNRHLAAENASLAGRIAARLRAA
ncbi:MAG: pseudouridine-5'-phosphate glycosidase [Geminicoccales bacterium]